MVKLFCVIVGVVGSAFSVRVNESDSVDDLKDAIKAKKQNDLQDVDADNLQLFLAKKVKAWLSSKNPAVISMRSGGIPAEVKALLNVEMDPADEIVDLFKGAPTKNTIHVLVVVDRDGLEAQDTEIAPHPSRKRRWDKLNEVLDKNRKAKKSAGSTGFSYVSFPEINNIMPAVEYEQTSKPIPDEMLDAVHGYFPLLIKAFGDIVTGKEAKRLHFIVPVLASVCALFNGDVRILAEETVVGKRVHGDGAFEFVLQRGDKRVCVVEAKRDDIQQGLAQAYIGSEALADVEGLTKVYSIVTNFVEWYFSTSLDEKIERTSPITISMKNHVPTRESVKLIAEMIYSILSDDN